MTLHVLLVEDDDNFVDELRGMLDSLPGATHIRVAGSRDEAYELLDDFVDLVVLDLKIPTMTNALDADPEHGNAVFNRIRDVAPGTPIFVLTGSPAESFLAELMMANQTQVDIWSEGEKSGTLLFLRKIDIDQCPQKLARVAQAVEGLSVVELTTSGKELTLAEDRLIRIFARRVSGRRCEASDLGGGLSDARVVRLRVTDHQGVTMHDAVAKLSSHADIEREANCYATHVTRLAPAATPRMLATLEYGAHSLAGMFVGLADGADASAFSILLDPDRVPADTICRVEAAMAPWIDGVPETSTSVANIRRRQIDDQSLEQLRSDLSLNWIQEFESRAVQARLGCCHGDLHGSNILVAPSGVQLIDYGDVGPGPASLDPVTLELSLLFHPDAPGKESKWPSPEQARNWGDLATYLDTCPFPEFVQECRAWAFRAAAGHREVAASAYSYLMRQLKYDDTDKDRAIALLEGVRNHFAGST